MNAFPWSMLVVAGTLASAALYAAPSAAQASDPAPTWTVSPAPRPDGTPWRLGYVESGIYVEYPQTLRAVIGGLEQLGWVTLDAPIPDEQSAQDIWQWLAQHNTSNYLTFDPSAYWRPGNFDTAEREPTRQAVLQRIQQDKDVDLLIAMGTWAGQDMRALGPPVPTVVTSVSDPLTAGIVDSIHDSGRDNLHTRIEPQRYQRQLRLFHEIVPFDTLGIVYEDSEAGRTYAAVGAIDEVSRQLGFKVVHCHAGSSNVSANQARNNAIACYRDLARQHVDAVYVTTHQGVTQESIVPIAEILREAGIPSFSMMGANDVRHGILLSLAQANLSYVGRFHAEAIARILNGAKPRDLDQVWIDPAKIALNLDTARAIGFDPPIDILLAADDVFPGE